MLSHTHSHSHELRLFDDYQQMSHGEEMRTKTTKAAQGTKQQKQQTQHSDLYDLFSVFILAAFITLRFT